MKKSLEENIKIAMDKHPSYYFYSNSFDSKDRKINIECPKHGLFRQRLYYSMIGCLCPKCAIEKRTEERRYTLDEFISASIKTHGERYDYSKVKYVNNNTKVCIICPEHGEFWQTPTSHINNKSGCPYCAGTKKRSSDEFIKKAREIHGDKYDYSKVNYVNQTTKVSIICPEHGEFLQTPKIHLRGFGCKICSNNYMNKDIFTQKSKEIHGDKYDYSRVSYINNHTMVSIICPEHGEFLQIPNSHLNGCGCPLCKTSHIEREINKLFNDELNIKFVYQYHNKDLFGQQSLDFFIPSLKLAIECQGEQHIIANFFKSKGIDYAEEHLEYIKTLDRKKKTICEENGIELIYYVDKRIKNYFNNYLGKVFHDKKELLDYIISK